MKVPNTDRMFGEHTGYVFVRIDGYDALLTPTQAEIAINRAIKQPEDVPGVWARLMAWLHF